jgi:F-type H+-transporting ATPase subunit gamma
MPSLKSLRNRIASVKATQKITKAMQMVAAAKLRRAQNAAEAARPYAERMNAVLANIAASAAAGGGASPLLAGTGSDQTHLIVVATGERGLAGAFNSGIARFAREDGLRLMREGKTVKFFCVGRKGYDILRRTLAGQIVQFVDLRGAREIGYEQADGIAKRILAMFGEGQFDVATLYFSRFRSVIAQVPTAQRLIPADVPAAGAKAPAGGSAYEYEPDEAAILAELLPRNIATQILRALLENQASFYGAQMSAMDNATRNAGDMIERYTLNYNRARQAQITKELIEIISGAEAV